MDSDPRENPASACYSMALLDVSAQYMAETYVLRNLLFEKGVLSPQEYDSALRDFLGQHWDDFRGEMNKKILARAKEYADRLSGPAKTQ